MCGGGLKNPGALKNSSQGMGPFVLTKVDPGQSYTFARRQALYRELDVVPVSDRYWYFYLRDAQASVTGFSMPVPTSIRVLR